MSYSSSLAVMIGFSVVGLLYVFGLYLASVKILANLKHRKAELLDLNKELTTIRDQVTELHRATLNTHREQRVQNEAVTRRTLALEGALEQIEIRARQLIGTESNNAKLTGALSEIVSLAKLH